MIDILSYLPVKRKQTPSGWVSFNCPCCQDKRSRGGIKTNDQGWSYHCFNCGYTASFVLGRTLGYKAKTLLSRLGVSDSDINGLNLESLRHRSIHGIIDDRSRSLQVSQNIEFEERDLPPYSIMVQPGTSQYQYLVDRGAPMDYPYMMQDIDTPHEGVLNPRPGVIVPFTYHDRVVGYATRFLDDRNPRYINEIQPGYVFGTDLQKADWQHALVVEGVFDALSISGLAVLHADINDAQVRLIRSLGREITVIPDQDQAGLALIDRALELGWAVSIPSWDHGIKDVNDAVVKYGKLATLLTIMQARETSRIKIELRKKNLVKRLRS